MKFGNENSNTAFVDAVFKIADTDHDGFVGKKELQRLHDSLGWNFEGSVQRMNKIDFTNYLEKLI